MISEGQERNGGGGGGGEGGVSGRVVRGFYQGKEGRDREGDWQVCACVILVRHWGGGGGGGGGEGGRGSLGEQCFLVQGS